MKIGVFDSGIGGKSVAEAIARAYPEHEILFRHDDPAHFPYATKTPDELLGFVVPVVQSLVDDGCQVIIIACNTVSTTLIDRLRTQFTTPLIAIEPMVKPASELTKTKVITVCATPTTLASERSTELKRQFATGVTVLEPDCADWSSLIEASAITKERIAQAIVPCLERQADVIVLGCTHYHWIAEDIDALCAGRATVMHPEDAIVRRLRTVLAPLV